MAFPFYKRPHRRREARSRRKSKCGLDLFSHESLRLVMSSISEEALRHRLLSVLAKMRKMKTASALSYWQSHLWL
jgi:hypothetical protein